jgi:two-component system nitrate/nitrite response regulator NarL
VRLYVVDDQASFREGLSDALGAVPGVDVVGATGDVDECIRQVAALQPEVVLVDLHLPERAALAAVSAIRAACPDARILVLALSEVANELSAVLRAGADGYLVKNLEDGLLVSSVRRALNGAAVLAATHDDSLHVRGESGPRPAHRPPAPVSLSPRERRSCAASRRAPTEIGRQLGVAGARSRFVHILPPAQAHRPRVAAVPPPSTGCSMGVITTPGK